MPPFAYFIPVILALAIAIGYFAWRAEKKRREALRAFAIGHGWRFDPSRDPGHDERYRQFEIFRRGHSRYAYNTITGSLELFGHDCRVRCGDYRYVRTSGSGKSHRTTTYRFSYLIVHPPWETPPLVIRPEGFLDKIAGALGFDDIDFESDEFSRRFYVKSTDKRFAYDVVHPRMMEFLLAEEPPMIEIAGGALCISSGRERWEPRAFADHLDFVRRFCEHWPRHLLKELDC